LFLSGWIKFIIKDVSKPAEIGLLIHNRQGNEEQPDWCAFSVTIAETGIPHRSKQQR
jgi:hypothetical protein